MKNVILIFALLGTLSASAKTNSLSGIKFGSYQGANVKGQCAPYALAVAFDLHKKGIETWYVEYDWKNFSKTGAHACTLVHADDHWYFVDNEWPRLSQVKYNENFTNMVKQRFSSVVNVRCKSTIGDPGDLKDLLTTTK